MTTTLEIITQAYRESNLIAIGAAPTSPQQTEALARLNAVVSSVYGYEVGDQLQDWPIGTANVTDATGGWDATVWSAPPANVRLIAASTTPQAVYLPPDPCDGARVAIIDPQGLLSSGAVTVYGNGRTIEGAASYTASVANAERAWLYRADKGDWKLLSTLTAAVDEEFPFPTEFDDYFITMLAMRLNPRYGRSISDLSVAAMERTLEKLRARYRQKVLVLGEAGPATLTSGYGGELDNSNPHHRVGYGWMQ